MSAAAIPVRSRNPFSPGTVLAVLAVGALAFLLMLYAIGQGWTGNSERNGGEHATSTALPGFKGLHDLLDRQGYDVQLSRSPAGYTDYGLLVLTPPQFTSADEIADVLDQRLVHDHHGPILLILPKWSAYEVPEQVRRETGSEDGWVILMDADAPAWFDGLAFAGGAELAVGQTSGWTGFDRNGALPDPGRVQALVKQPEGDTEFIARVVDGEGDLLVGEVDDPLTLSEDVSGQDLDPYPVMVVFEPDIMNNYGLADRSRAELSMAIIDTLMAEDPDMPVIFDMTLPGLAASENLLTLAFRPPFLSATLCLLFAALVIIWRSFNRFGPPVAEMPSRAQGKRQLARNGAALVARVKRFHLLADPYAALMGKRIAAKLGIRENHPEARAAAIDRALARRGFEGPTFLARANDLRAAGNPKDIIRAAAALKDLERTLKQ